MYLHIIHVERSGLGHAGLNDFTVMTAAAKAWEDELDRPTCKVAEHVAAVGIELAGVVVMQAPAGVHGGPAGPGTAFALGDDGRGLCLLPRLSVQDGKHLASQVATPCMQFDLS